MSQERSLNSGLSITIAIQTVLQRSPVFLAIIPKSRTLKKICVSHFAAKLELLRLLFMVLNETVHFFVHFTVVILIGLMYLVHLILDAASRPLWGALKNLLTFVIPKCK